MLLLSFSFDASSSPHQIAISELVANELRCTPIRCALSYDTLQEFLNQLSDKYHLISKLQDEEQNFSRTPTIVRPYGPLNIPLRSTKVKYAQEALISREPPHKLSSDTLGFRCGERTPKITVRFADCLLSGVVFMMGVKDPEENIYSLSTQHYSATSGALRYFSPVRLYVTSNG